jgi:CBS domain-containing protein
MKVIDMMHRGVECVEPNTTVSAIARIMRDYDIGAMPVCEDGKPIGIVTDRDITLRAVGNNKDVSQLKAKDVMTRNVIYCRDTEEAEDAIRIMESNQIRRLPVLGETEQLVGMISWAISRTHYPKTLACEVTKAVSAHHS